MYRPSIPPSVDTRVDLYMAGQQGDKNKIYCQAIKFMLDSQGNRRHLFQLMLDEEGQKQPWFERLEQYADDTDQDLLEVLNHLMTQVIDEDGEPTVRFKERLKLE